jgi:preprotein translocase subunit SecE
MAERRTPNPDAGGSSPSWPANLVGKDCMENEKLAVILTIKQFFKEIKAETKKITWSDRKQVTSGTIAVIILSIIISVFLSLIDASLSQVVRLLLGIG